MTDINIKKQRIYQYHEVVVVNITVDEDGQIVEVGDPYLEDEGCLPLDGRTVFSEDDWDDDPNSDGWLDNSPADYDEDGVRTGAAHVAAFDVVREALTKFADRRVLPCCVSCSKPIPEGETHTAGADPCCADCWHEGADEVGEDCDQGGYKTQVAYCASCGERIADDDGVFGKEYCRGCTPRG